MPTAAIAAALPRRRAVGAAATARGRASAGAVLVAAYLGTVWLLAELTPLLGLSHRALADAVAFSPLDLVHGRLWLLPLSGLVADGNTVAQLAKLAPIAACVVLLAGAPAFWRAAIAGHVGSTLVAYAIVGILTLADPTAVHGVAGAPDFGISCVYAGALGGLAVAATRHCRRAPAKVAVVVAAALPMAELLAPGFVTDGGLLQLATVEHTWAFLLGAAAVAVDWTTVRRALPFAHRGTRSARGLALAPAGARP